MYSLIVNISVTDMSMTRHVARDVSQQPGFVETLVTLAESVAKNVSLQVFVPIVRHIMLFRKFIEIMYRLWS